MQQSVNHRKRETNRLLGRKRREALRNAGLCYVCGIVSTTSGRCDGCRKRQADRRDAVAVSIKDKQRRKLRKELGICERCSAAVVPGLTICERHRKRKLEQNRKYCQKKAGASPNAWFLSFDYETTPTVFEMGVQ